MVRVRVRVRVRVMASSPPLRRTLGEQPFEEVAQRGRVLGLTPLEVEGAAARDELQEAVDALRGVLLPRWLQPHHLVGLMVRLRAGRARARTRARVRVRVGTRVRVKVGTRVRVRARARARVRARARARVRAAAASSP